MNITPTVLIIETIGWASTAAFLISIVVPKRMSLHQLGVFASVTTGVYAFAHGATAIWVKWFIAFFFHGYMIFKIYREKKHGRAADDRTGDRTDDRVTDLPTIG